jgi:hypothetical protein
VTQDALELQIQDYLDDRMSDGDRRAFEERLTGDAGLGARVRDLRAISEALRQDAPDLPPGFHTRLRARFEARHAPVRRWFRPLSWETAGLIAAVAVAAVLFAPTEKESRQNETRDAVEQDRIEAVGSEALEEDTDFAPAPESIPEPVVESGARLERRDGPAKSRPAPPPPSAKLKKDENPALSQQAPTEPERAERSRSDKKGAVGAPADPEATAAGGRATLEEAKDELRAQNEGFDYRSIAAGGIALTAGVVEAGKIVEIRSEEQWDRVGLDVGRGRGDALGEYDPVARLVLVGAREIRADCELSVVVAVDEVYEIRLAAATGAATEPDHGCAFRLPADDRPVRIIEPTGDR